MAAATPEELEPVRHPRVRDLRLQRRRTAFVAAAVLAAVVIVVVVLSRARGGEGTDPGAVASPVSASVLELGVRPPDRVIARSGTVEIHLPVDRAFVGATLFRPIDDTDGVALSPEKGWKHVVAPRDGREGPQTAALDIAAPAGSVVYAPVDGSVASVSPYVVAGKPAGYQLDISPDVASDVVLRVRHIESIPIDRDASSVCGAAGVEKPRVGSALVAGVTCIGQVRDASDLVDVARPEIAKYVSDGGSHVHMEVVRVGS